MNEEEITWSDFADAPDPEDVAWDPEASGVSIVTDWLELFSRHYYDDDRLPAATFFLLVGQLPNIRKLRIERAKGTYLDPRVHVIHMAPSASGKGVAAGITMRMAEKLGIKAEVVGKLTDAALVGTVSFGKSGEEKITKGLLDYEKFGIDLFVATEASMLLHERQPPEAVNVMSYLQTAMNPLGSPDSIATRKTGVGETILKAEPKCSLYLMTYPPDNLTNLVLKRGLLQRMAVVVTRSSVKRRRKVMHKKHQSHVSRIDTTVLEDSVVRRLKRINDYYATATQLEMTDDARKCLTEFNDLVYDAIDGMHPFFQDKLGEIATRFEDLQIKVAMHFACLNLHSRIEYGDALQAGAYLKPIYYDFASFVETTIPVPEEFEDQLRRMVGAVKVTMLALDKTPKYAAVAEAKRVYSTDDLVRNMPRFAGIKPASADYVIGRLRDWGVFSVWERDGRAYVRLLPLPRALHVARRGRRVQTVDEIVGEMASDVGLQ